MKIRILLSSSLFSLLLSLSPNLLAGDLPAYISFDGDVPGFPPSTGDTNQPTSIIENPASIVVQPSALGIETQPAVITADGWHEWGIIVYSFPAVQLLAIEAKVSVDRYFDGILLQTTEGIDGGAVVTRIIALSDGTLRAEDLAERPVIATYVPNSPIYFRMEIDVTAGTWTFAIDGQTPVVDLPFTNPPHFIDQVGSLWASLDTFPTPASSSGAVVAYDDIYIQDLQLPPLSKESKKCLARLHMCFKPEDLESLLITPPDAIPGGGNTCSDRCSGTEAPRNAACDLTYCTILCEVAFGFSADSCPTPNN